MLNVVRTSVSLFPGMHWGLLTWIYVDITTKPSITSKLGSNPKPQPLFVAPLFQAEATPGKSGDSSKMEKNYLRVMTLNDILYIYACDAAGSAILLYGDIDYNGYVMLCNVIVSLC